MTDAFRDGMPGGVLEVKAADLSAIEIPAYVVASWTNPAHTVGTTKGFEDVASREKWLRVHGTQEWQDFYSPRTT